MTTALPSFASATTADEVLADLDLSSRTVLVTGASAGIGWETARALCARGAHVLLACRDRARGSAAVARIQERHPDARAELLLLDLSSLGQVRELGRGLTVDKLDAVICNAGVYGGGYRETADGFERVVGVCHLGHFLLVQELLERLLRSDDPRVVMVSSESHRTPAKLDFDKLPLPARGYRDMVAYGQAKLCNVLMAKELSRRYGERGLTAYSLHPGTLIATEIGRDSLIAKAVLWLGKPFTKSLAQGAATSVLCACHPAARAHDGAYFRDCQPVRSSRESCDPEVAAELWRRSEAWVGEALDG